MPLNKQIWLHHPFSHYLTLYLTLIFSQIIDILQDRGSLKLILSFRLHLNLPNSQDYDNDYKGKYVLDQIYQLKTNKHLFLVPFQIGQDFL